jgi:hypothetical protein
MKKLKTLLEGLAWERSPGQPLPTMKDVAAKHNINEGKFREGDIVVPNIGPHKGVKHIIIYDFGDGKYNIQPIGLRPNKIQYRLGSAGAREDQLKRVGFTPAQPSPEIMDTSGMSKPEIARALGDMTKKKGLRPNESAEVNEAPMDDRFAKEYEKSGQAIRNHLKHELSKSQVYTANQERELQRLDQIIKMAIEVPKQITNVVNEPGKVRTENKSSKLKDILGEK